MTAASLEPAEVSTSIPPTAQGEIIIDSVLGRRTPQDLLARFHDAMLALSADDLAELHAVDAVYDFPLLTPGRPERYLGREEIRRGFAEVWDVAARTLRVTEIRDVVVHPTVDPEVIVAEQRAAITVFASGDRYVVPSLVILTAREGLIVAVRDYSAGTRRPAPRDTVGSRVDG